MLTYGAFPPMVELSRLHLETITQAWYPKCFCLGAATSHQSVESLDHFQENVDRGFCLGECGIMVILSSASGPISGLVRSPSLSCSFTRLARL